MGVEYYIVCRQCKQYIDMHKAYALNILLGRETPPPDVGSLSGSYWEARGVWFLWNHRGHEGIELMSDANDEWFEVSPYLNEVFPHDEDIKLRGD